MPGSEAATTRPDQGVEVRAGTEADLAKLAGIEAAADAQYAAAGHPELADGSTIPEQVARAAIEQGRLAVATVAGQPVGWVYWGRVGTELSIGQICVIPEYGRQGIGTALVRHVLDRALAAAEPTVILNTQSDVAWNEPWYRHLGFSTVPESEWTPAMRAVSRQQAADGLDWSSRVHMRLRLTEPAG
jgi:ribosomal protein S18 acetylase RimI-like enzyme